MINAGFDIGLAGLMLLRPFVVAAYLTRTELGLWSLVVTSLFAVLWIKQIGIQDKYIQQREADQERAFRKAFTLELATSVLAFLLAAAMMPVFAVIYGQPGIIVPGLIVALAIPLSALRTPVWIFYRQLNYGRQRTLEAIDPVLGLLATLAFAAAGFGYWAFVAGFLIGGTAAALAAVRASPFRLRLAYERGTLREYATFSWPLLAASASGLVVSQGSLIVGSRTVGLAAIGALWLGGNISAYATRVDRIITTALYPAICAVRDRADLLFESFIKSNRLALMWALPFGVGLTLFAPDLVSFVLGERWLPAVFLLQVYGLANGLNQLGFNWTAYLRARGDTRPIAMVSAIGVAAFVAIPLPLLALVGLDAYAVGMGVAIAINIITRMVYLSRMFSPVAMLRHTVRAFLPVVPPAALVVGMRLAEPAGRSAWMAVAEFAAYAAVTVVATVVFERALLHELLGYVRPSLGRQPRMAH